MRFLKAFHYILTRAVILIMLLLLLISGYFVWSNRRTYMDAEDVFQNLLQLKPEETVDGKVSLDELKAINPDVCGWLTVDGTKIDYPVVYGRDNLYYMNRDFYRNSSLAGSIFLDTRSNRDFLDPYSLIYGHHMDNSLMFGDLDLFKDETFFQLNSTAKILTENRVIDLKILALLELPDSTEEIFNPTRWENDLSEFGAFIKDNAIYVRESALEQLTDQPTMMQAVALVTCSSGHTGLRTVLILVAPRSSMIPQPSADTPQSDDVSDSQPPAKTGDRIVHAPLFWILLLGIGILVLGTVIVIEKRNKTQ